MKLNDLKNYYPGCKIIEGEICFDVYLRADSIFNFYVEKNSDMVMADNVKRTVVKLYNKHLNSNNPLTNPHTIASYLDDVITSDDHSLRNNYINIFVNMENEKDVQHMIKAVYSAYTMMLNELLSYDTPSKTINLHLDEESVSKYSSKLRSLKPRIWRV